MIKQIVNEQPLGNLLKSLCLPTFASQYQSVAQSFEQDGKTYTDYLQELAIRELEHRHQQRIARLLKQAKLSRDNRTGKIVGAFHFLWGNSCK